MRTTLTVPCLVALAASSEYTVEARGTVDGQAWSRVWRFTTGR
jgi:hypothetical protein